MDALLKHEAEHTVAMKKQFVCEKCGKRYSQKTTLAKHYVDSHKASNDLYRTETRALISDYEFEYTTKFGRVIQTRHQTSGSGSHSEERKYTCDECGESFRKKYDLVIHSYGHMADKHFACVECGKLFISKVDLAMHRLTHVTNSKPFVCSKCGVGFTTRAALVVHLRVHVHEEQFICDVCGLTFRRMGKLVAHHATHPEGGAKIP